MPKLSPARACWPVFSGGGIKLLNRGKVRDCYLLPGGQILQVATDAISIFDFILNAMVPMKGAILTAISVFWFLKLREYGIKTHLIAYGSGIDEYLPEALRGNADLQSRALVVEKLDMVDDVEFIIRAVLTGSSVRPYQVTGMVCGEKLPEGLQDGDLLPYLLDSPSTKAQEGHDEHISSEEIRQKYPRQTNLALRCFQIVQGYARERGIFLADTKLEFGKNGKLADEAFTPDSSRFWLESEWLDSRRVPGKRKAPASYDKQPVRNFGKTLGIDQLDPRKPEDVAKVHAMEIPDWVIKQTTERYRYIFWRLTGMTIEEFLSGEMGIELPERPEKNILVVLGSDSDLPYVESACTDFGIKRKLQLSCHRNPDELRAFVRDLSPSDVDAVVACGGKAFALPGVVDAWCHRFNNGIPVIGVALGKPGSQDLLAAQLSILELPGQPVIFNEIKGEAYTNTEGFREALDRIQSGELPPSKPRLEKPSRWL